jgi:glycosyltransferase involved in cell wall biosynthesis
VPRVSVLLPCRDAAEHLPHALDSLAAQRFEDFEVLAVDDASTDDTRAILTARAASDPRFRVLDGPGVGITAALRLAAQHANGELVARMDADDIAHHDRLAAQVNLLDACPDIGACGTGVRYFPDSVVRDGARRYERWINSLASPEAVARDLFVECPLAHPTLMLRRSALEVVGGYREVSWPEDYDLVFRLHAAGALLTNVPRVLHHWRERPERLSRRDSRYSADAFRRCKVHYLAPRIARHAGVVVCGAGPIGKAFARTLIEAGSRVRAFVDVDPRKIGQTVYAAQVLPPAALDELRGTFAVAAVGSERGREEIRRDLIARGWREITDFVAVA